MYLIRKHMISSKDKRSILTHHILNFAIVISCLSFSCKSIKSSPAVSTKPFITQVQVFPFAPGNKPNYRIPAIAKAGNGDLLIFAEKRRKGIADVGYTDIVMTRSI